VQTKHSTVSESISSQFLLHHIFNEFVLEKVIISGARRYDEEKLWNRPIAEWCWWRWTTKVVASYGTSTDLFYLIAW